MNYYKRHLGDYAKKAGRLSMLQHGSYTLLIDACYDREEFPTLEQAIEWTWASTTEEIEAVTFVLRKFFILEDGVYVQKRIQEEIAEYQDKAETNKRIALERETKRRENSTTRARSVDDALPESHEPPPSARPSTNQEPLTINHKPDSVTNVTGDKSPMTPTEIAYSYGLPILTTAGTPEKQARSFLGGLLKQDPDKLVDVLRECIRAKPIQPLEWIAKAMPPNGADSSKKLNKQEALEARNRAVADAWVVEMESKMEVNCEQV